MKMMIVLATLAAVAVAAPLDSDVVVVNETPLDNIGTADYKYGYQLSNGAAKEEYGQLIDAGTENQHYRVTGRYVHVDPVDNVAYEVKYYADENGFHAEGPHLPV